ncbi:MAG: hypothetical protein AABW50_03420 [Nanoarchaeota archaeon]
MKTQIIEPEEINLLRQDFLSQEEIFLLKFINGFNRKVNREWAEKGLWEISNLE